MVVWKKTNKIKHNKSLTLGRISLKNKIKLLAYMALFAVSCMSGAAHAQLTNTGTNVEQRNFTQSTNEKNATASCDSTCDAMGATAPASSMSAAFITRISACGAGFTGNKTQTRNQLPDGSYTAWTDADTSHCVCSPTHMDTTQTCISPLAGSYVQRTPWVCSGNVGSWGTPSTISGSCFTPCALPSPSTQYTSNACPAGYTGTYNYQRNASCPGGVGSNSVATWSGWNLTSSSCVPRRYSASEFGGIFEAPYAEGLTGHLYIYNSTGVTFTLDANPMGGWAPYTIYDNTEGVTYPFTSATSYGSYGNNRQVWGTGTWIAFPAGAASRSSITLPNGQVLSGYITTGFSYFSITP